MADPQVTIAQARVEAYSDADELEAALGRELVLPEPWPAGLPEPNRFELLRWPDGSRGFLVGPEQDIMASADRWILVTGNPGAGSGTHVEERFITSFRDGMQLSVRCTGLTDQERADIGDSLAPRPSSPH